MNFTKYNVNVRNMLSLAMAFFVIFFYIFTPEAISANENIREIEDIEINQKEVTAGENVKINIKINNHQDVKYILVWYLSPVNGDDNYVHLYYNEQSASFEGNIPITNFSENGEYKITRVSIYDSTNVIGSIFESDYFLKGNFHVYGTTGELIENISVDHSLAHSGDTVTISAILTDPTGIDYLLALYESPVTKNNMQIELIYNSELNSYIGSYPIFEDIEPGDYQLSRLVTYGANMVSVDHSPLFKNGNFKVEGTYGKGSIETFSVDKNKATFGENVNFNMKVTNENDLRYILLWVTSPITKENKYVYLYYNNDAKSYEGSTLIQKGMEIGSYEINRATFYYNGYTYDLTENTDLLNGKGFSVYAEKNPPTFVNINSDKKMAKLGVNLIVSVDANDDALIEEGKIIYISPISKNSYSIPLIYNNVTKKLTGSFDVTDETEEGLWKIASIEIKDTNENIMSIDTGDADLKQGYFTVDKTAPETPTAENVTNDSTVVTGKSEAAATINIMEGMSLLGTGVADNNGIYTIKIPRQNEGVSLLINGTDKAGNTSSANEIIVKDVIAPTAPQVNEVTDNTTTVSGTSEVGSIISIQAGTTKLGTATTNNEGKYAVSTAKQKAGTKLTVTATDKAGNSSEAKEVTVTDKSVPNVPTVNEVTDNTTTVSGMSEVGSIINIQVGTTKLGTATTNNEGKYAVTIAKQKAGTKLTVIATDKAGNNSKAKEVIVTDKSAPAVPTVHEVTDNTTTIIGTAETGATIDIKVGTSQVGTAIANNEGKYTVSIAKQKAGTKLTVIATDKDGNSSEAKEVIVTDKTAPALPTVNEVTDNTTTVSGTSEVGSIINIQAGTTKLGTATTNNEGKYAVSTAKQKAGTKLTVIATDKAGNNSEAKEVTVTDKTAPAAPMVNEVTDNITTVKGTAEAGATIKIKVGTNILASGLVNTSGLFSITIPKQKAGEQLQLTATDKDGNIRDFQKITVSDATVPTAPSVNSVYDNSSVISGKGESNASVYAIVGSKKIGETIAKNGTFSINIAKQKAGTSITVYVVDSAGNKSAGKTVNVMDKTAPSTPTVNLVYDYSTVISGKAESNATVYAMIGSKKLGQTTAKNGSYTIKIAKQKAGASITVYAMDDAANKSSGKAIKVIDKTAPSTPTINSVYDYSTIISGKAETNATVYAMVGSKKIGQATTKNGSYSIKIPKQKSGTSISVYVKDSAGNKGKSKVVKVIDKTAPSVPFVNKITSKTVTVTGNSEIGATIYIYDGKKKLGQGIVDNKGKYKIKIKAQKKGKLITIYSKDKAGNKSKNKTIKIS